MEIKETNVSYPFPQELMDAIETPSLVGVDTEDLEKLFGGKNGVMLEFVQGDEDAEAFVQQLEDALKQNSSMKSSTSVFAFFMQNEEENALEMPAIFAVTDSLQQCVNEGTVLLWGVGETTSNKLKIVVIGM